MKTMQGRTVFITGGSRGIGRAIAIKAAQAGANVVIAAKTAVETPKLLGTIYSVAEEIKAAGGKALPLILDVREEQKIHSAIQHTVETFGGIDVLINNAAVSGFGLLEGYSIDQVRRMFDVNVYSVLRMYQAVLPSMRKERNGLVINITTGASGHTLPFMVPYIASKLVVESFTEGLQDELADYGIENVSIQPGVYPTEMNNGSKAGIHADKTEIIEEYGESATEKFNALGTALFGKMAQFDMNPQTIADGILELVNMKKGERPLRFPLDAIAQGTDKEFIEARAAIKAKWVAAYTN